MPTAVTRDYIGKDQEMLDVSKKLWALVNLNLPAFTAASGNYVSLFVTGKLAAITAAENLPDFQVRISPQKTLREALLTDKVEILRILKLMKVYAANAITNPVLLAIAYTAMGDGHAAEAADNDWDAMNSLLISLNAWGTANSAMLLATGNMPATFLAELATATTDFTTHLAAYQAEIIAVHLATQAKIIACNAVYADLQKMLTLAQILGFTPALKKEFNYGYQLRAIRGSNPGTKGHLYSAATLAPIPFARVEFTDTGAVVYTDADGAFIIHAASGSHDLKITAPTPSVGPPYMTYYNTVFVLPFTVSTHNFYMLQ